MPMNSYTSIFHYLSHYILPYLKDVEAENRIYFSAAQNDSRKLDIARNVINHNKFTMNTIEKNKQELLVELQNVSVLVVLTVTDPGFPRGSGGGGGLVTYYM